MPTVDVEENIKKLRTTIEQMTQEIFRLQGMLAAFEGFKKGGLTHIEMPLDPNQPAEESTEELESIQEKPE